MAERIYLDHAATTPIRQEVLEGMLPFLQGGYGNASSVHMEGRIARRAVEEARRRAARALGADPDEIFFTSGGTESDNWALNSTEGEVVTSCVEHHAVLHTCEALERTGRPVCYLPVDGSGRVSIQSAEEAVSGQTGIVSVMTANNEIGTLEPVRELAQIAHRHHALFHTDAVQAFGHIPVNVEEMNCDLLSLSAHKFGGPKGTGLLYVRRGTRFRRWVQGGEQERRMRAGTENVAGIVGMGLAMELAVRDMEADAAHMRRLRDRLEECILRALPDTLVNGAGAERLPGTLNVSFPGLQGESVLLRLDLAGIAASSGSACTAGSLDPSHVLLAIGRSRREAEASLRLTIGRENTEEEMDRTCSALTEIVPELRSMRA